MIVGLTGGIASGKTAVSDYLAELGIPVVDADIVARQVVEPGQPALASIAQHFGHELLQADGSLDRAALRQRIFNNHQEKQWLEALLHPLIRTTIRKQLDDTQGPYKLLVAPLLLENGLESMVDRVLVIDAPVDAQLIRGAARDNNSREQIEQIVAAQLPREQRVAKADDVICNDQDLEHLQKQARALHQRYLELAKAHDRI